MLKLISIKLSDANAFVAAHHRHHRPVTGHKFSLGCEQDGRLVGVAIVGRPVSRYLDDGKTLEVNRLCVPPGRKTLAASSTARRPGRQRRWGIGKSSPIPWIPSPAPACGQRAGPALDWPEGNAGPASAARLRICTRRKRSCAMKRSYNPDPYYIYKDVL